MVFIIESISLSELKDKVLFLFRRIFRSRIFVAIEKGNEDEAIRIATPNILRRSKGIYGESPLVAAIGKGSSQLCMKLIDMGGSYEGDGALILATMNGREDVVKALLNNGKDPNDRSGNTEYHEGFTPLMWATNRHYPRIMEMLLEAGADVNAVSERNDTAAIYTRKGDKEDLIALEILCKHGANISIRDWRGRSTLDEAIDRKRYSGKKEMLEIIKRYNPDVFVGDA